METNDNCRRSAGQDRFRKKRGSLFVEAALTVPVLLMALLLLCFLVRLDAVQEREMYELAKETEKTLLPNLSTYNVRVPIPLFGRTLHFAETIVAHPFIGEAPQDDPLGAEALEDDGSEVWVFPRRGEKYHKEECRIVTVYPFERILSRDLRRRYEPCRNCDPETLPNGTPVYVFETGKVYHRESCASVTRYVVPTSRQQAEKEGYTPCSYCSMNGTE